MSYPYTADAMPICTADEKVSLGARWKSVRNRFVYALRELGFERSRGDERPGCYVYDKGGVAVFVTRRGIPSVRGTGGEVPNSDGVSDLQELWADAKIDVDKRQ